MDDPAQLLLRFAHYAFLLGLFGLMAFRAFGLQGVTLGDDRTPGVVAAAVAAPLVSAALFLASVAAMMGQAVGMVEWSVVEGMLTTTELGWAFAARFALLILAVVPILLRSRRRSGDAVAALLYGGALLTLPWSGHAAATQGSLGVLHKASDALHLLAAGYWIGAIGWFAALAVRAHQITGQIELRQLLSAMQRFRPVGITLVAVVALTGALNAHLIFGVDNSMAILATTYGQFLAAKIILVMLMVASATRHAGPARRQDVPDRQVLASVRRSLSAELAIAVAVLAAVAALGMSSPMPEPLSAATVSSTLG